MGAPDKRIADWLDVSLPTYYRWRKEGLLPRRPGSAAEAREMRALIEAARDAAAFARLPGRRGRTRITAVAQALGGQT